MAASSVTGGGKLAAALQKIAQKIDSAQSVKVGFLEGATYPDGTSIAYIASVNEFGGTATIPAHTQTVYREVNKAGTGFNKSGRFVKADKANFASDHDVAEYTVTIPPRPFFRSMVKQESPHWGADLGKLLKANDLDAAKALEQMGEEIADELRMSIKNFTSPPNAQSTIAKKGFDKPLIDTGVMLNSVDKEVE